MAENRSMLAHLLNVSVPYVEPSSTTFPDYVLICDSSELSESFDPDTKETRYICQDTKTTTILGYTISFDIESEYNKDSRYIQYISRYFINKPKGSTANGDYLRFLKTDLVYGTSNKYFGVRQPCTVAPSEIGGSSDDPLGMTVTVNGRGDSVPGYITYTDGAYSFEPATTAIPSISDPKYSQTVASDSYHIKGTGVADATITITNSNGVVLGTATVVGTEWECTLSTPLSEGSNTLVATQKVGTMDSLPSMPVTFTVTTSSTIPASPAFLLPVAGSTVVETKPKLVGTGIVGATVTVKQDTTTVGTAVVTSNGMWTYTPTTALAPGETTLSATQIISGGSVASDPETVTFTISDT